MPMKSHFISQVLLRRFSVENRLKVYNKITTKTTFKSPEEIAYIEFPDIEIALHERKWARIESMTATAFEKLDQGTVLEFPKYIVAIKKFMALHYIRSFTLPAWMKQNEDKYFQKEIKNSIEAHPDKTIDILRNKEPFKTRWHEILKQQIPDVIKTNHPKIEAYVMHFDLEIGVADQGTDFYLGDIPLINMDKQGRLGVLSGVDITHSENFVLPLGPRHIAALITKNESKEYRKLSNREVKNCNIKTKDQSVEQYYIKPKSYEMIY